MHVTLHIGAHCTGGDLLVRSLRRNLSRIGPMGISVPQTEHYHAALRDAVNGLEGQEVAPDMETRILDHLLDGEAADRVVLSNQSFICVPDRAAEGGRLYPLIRKAHWLRNLFPSHEVSFHLCLRDPATFLPALFRTQSRASDFGQFLGGADLAQMRWSDPVAELLETCPDVHLTIWCYEDAPLIWEQVMRSAAGIREDVALHGMFDMAAQVMAGKGMATLRNYIARRPPTSRAGQQRVTAAFIEAFGSEDTLFEEPPIPEWDEEFCARLTELYEEDLARIVAMDRVTAITR